MEPQPTYEYVDLGLPSGLKWATCNVGANNPLEYGKYFAWGDTEGYYDNEEHEFSQDYKFGSYEALTKYNTDSDYGTIDNKVTLDPEDDAAHVNMGGDWRMPTEEELNELINNTTNEWITVNGVKGRKFINTTDSSKYIFIPASGSYYGLDNDYQGQDAYVWTSSLETTDSAKAVILSFSQYNCKVSSVSRMIYGLCVRGVLDA
ncbi:hypothetical protein [Sodaliphilus sp.]|uniref:hypothetical protein n=1 Tax=Sodaliphilus sp. TaxID=2815818 RepID=UPI00388DEA5F